MRSKSRVSVRECFIVQSVSISLVQSYEKTFNPELLSLIFFISLRLKSSHLQYEFGMVRILFVCHGNICRSPMAEFVMKDLVHKAGRDGDFHIESAATSTEEIGNEVYPPARRSLPNTISRAKAKRQGR